MLTKETILKLVQEGVPFTEAQKRYPTLLKGTYKRFGGILCTTPRGPVPGRTSEKRVEVLNDAQVLTLSELLFKEARTLSSQSSYDYRKTIHDSLFGDGHLTPSPYFTEKHSFAQAPYLWAKACLLGQNLSTISLAQKEGKKPNEDAVLSLGGCTDNSLKALYVRFYKGPQGAKDLMHEEVYQYFDTQTLAWWLMDDGTRANPGGGVKLTIGKQPHYSLEGARNVARWILEKTGYKGSVLEQETSYLISYSRDIEGILPYVHPNLAYKFTYSLWREEIGAYWPQEILTHSRKLFAEIEHPYLEGASSEEKATYLVSRTRARGFPFPERTPGALKELWQFCKRGEAQEAPGDQGRALYANTKYNSLPSHFFPNRYLVSSAGRKSPVHVFCHKRALKKVLLKQAQSGGPLEDSNIRNAMSFYAGAKVAAQFNPLWAKWLISTFIEKQSTPSRVLDICGGWGGRMVGTALAGCSYSFIEPEPDTFNGLITLKEFLQRECGVFEEIGGVQGRAEDINSYSSFKGLFDMLLTCPPYFDYEKYSSHKDQSIVRFVKYRTWLHGFLKKALENALSHLKERAPVILVVGDIPGYSLVSDTLALCLSLGLQLEEIVGILGSKGVDKNYTEKALVLRKV